MYYQILFVSDDEIDRIETYEDSEEFLRALDELEGDALFAIGQEPLKVLS